MLDRAAVFASATELPVVAKRETGRRFAQLSAGIFANRFQCIRQIPQNEIVPGEAARRDSVTRKRVHIGSNPGPRSCVEGLNLTRGLTVG